jgi:DNA-binding NarL/FixJ family response regulator
MIHIACFRDQYYFSDAIIEMLDDNRNFKFDVVSTTLADLLYKIRHHKIDLVLLVHDDDTVSLKQLIHGIKVAYPRIPIVYVQPDRDVQKAKEIENLGVHVYLYRMTVLTLMDCILGIVQRHLPSIRRATIFLPDPDFTLSAGHSLNPFSLLTSPEKKIICLLAEDMERHQIAYKCNLSIHTVNKYIQKAKEKCGCQNTEELLVLCENDIRLLASKKEILNINGNDKSTVKDKRENLIIGTK